MSETDSARRNDSGSERFKLRLSDFLSAREREGAARTLIREVESALETAGERYHGQEQETPSQEGTGDGGDTTERPGNVVSPVIIPRRQRALLHFTGFLLLLLPTISIWAVAGIIGSDYFLQFCWVFLGPTLWAVLLFYLVFILWKRSTIMVPDGFQALVTRFGRLERVAEAGRLTLVNPWKRVSYLINTATEFPYNAPIREAPTASRIMASVDLFLQFRIEDPAEFIFALGGTEGFEEKLHNAVSEVTRSLIYEQKAEAIYDLVGENMAGVLEALNSQFLPAVQFVRANITHAEPSEPNYRMDLAAREFMRVAEDAYSFEYELRLRKENDRGDLNKELAGLRRTLSEIEAETARYQALVETAREREMNRVTTRARRILIEATSGAEARSALFEAQALDVRALALAQHPVILRHRYKHEILDSLESLSDRMPQVIRVGSETPAALDFEAIGRNMLGISRDGVDSVDALSEIRERAATLEDRIRERAKEIKKLTAQTAPMPTITEKGDS